MSKRRREIRPRPDIELLREAVTRHNRQLLPLLDTLGSHPLTQEQRDLLQEAVAAEFVEFGLEEDDEPNALGLRLDELIGHLNHL